jgi:deazaflavin-dependent oxidoreductase (nitroreductase family)
MRLSKTKAARLLLSKVLTPLDLRLKNSGFAPTRFRLDLPLCYLTTMGRTSGEPRIVPLLFIGQPTSEGEPGAFAVAATNFGTEHHPGWSYNLDATPSGVLEIGDKSFSVTSRLLSEQESAAMWPRFEAIWPAYGTYRQIAPRDIKVYLLTRAG